MSFTANVSTLVSGATASTYQSLRTITAAQRVSVDEAAPADSTTVINAPVDVSACKLFVIISNGADVVVKTNDATTPDNTFTLEANKPFIWPQSTGDAFVDTAAVAVSTDIATLHVVNASPTLAATIRLDALVDPTP